MIQQPLDVTSPSRPATGRRRLLAIGSAALTLAMGAVAAHGHDHPGYAYASDLGYHNPDWLGSIPDWVRLGQLSLPGTHDTMAYQGGGLTLYTRTQTLDLPTQLLAGIRVLDIRARHFHDRFAMHHGPVYLDAFFEDVLDDVAAFLAAHPDETILMRVRQEHTATGNTRSFEETFAWYQSLPAYEDLFWSYDGPNPRLGDVRGRIVVLQDFAASSRTRFGLAYRDLAIQDQFSLSSITKLYDKWLAVKNHLNAAAGRTDSNRLYLNFLSGFPNLSFPYFVASGHSSHGTSAPRLLTGLTTPGFNGWYPDFPRVSCVIGICSIAYEGTNVLATDYIAATEPAYVGILMADFPGAGLIDEVISLNDQYVPVPLDSMALHLDASDPAGFGTSCPVGTTIHTWLDLSGRYRDMRHVHSGGSIRCEGNFNGKPGLRFRAVEGDVLASVAPLPYGASDGGEMTVIVAGSFASTATDAMFLEHGPNTNTTDGFYLYGHGANPFRLRQNGQSHHASTEAGWMGNGSHAIALRVDTSGLLFQGAQLFVDGALDRLVWFSDLHARTGTLYLGGRPALGQAWDGTYFEVLVYDRALSDAELGAAFRYLNEKWGTPLH